ncbi:MAG: trypsin-like peptidase domain-containing protein [Chloroflexi bacterium]|nr:trypsin-like peptidase domain-containing protein [Chloroflexota bacterium]
MNDDNVRLQNLRDFTVQIRRPADDAIVGTGVAVSMDGQVVTCAHVVKAALGVHPRKAGDAEVGIYFPQARGGEVKARRARVAACFQHHDDDVVLLQLTGGPSPLAPEQIAVLGRAEESCYHSFRSYGYRRLENYTAGHAHGLILDCVPPPEGRNVQAEPVQLESQQINCGMSGAGVLDIERNLVVGIVSETWFPGVSPKDRDTAWAVNGRVLTFDPLNLPLRDAPFPKRAAPQPRTDVAAALAAVAPELGTAFHGAPPPLVEWVGRDDLLASISSDWAAPDRSVTGLIGFGGEGKSSLARQWVDSLGGLPNRPTDGLFLWGFYDRPGVDEFFEAALAYMGGGRIDPRGVPSANVRAQVIGAMLGAGRYLFVLDGLEVMQRQEGDQYGLLKSADLREFLALFAAPGHQSFCLVTSRAPLLDLMAYTTYTHRDVTRLSPADGRALLREVGVDRFAELPPDQVDKALDKIVTDWDGHALTLGLLGGHIAAQYGGDAARAGEIDPPAVDEPRYERVHRVLRRYDEHLTAAERDFLMLFSAFRTPVHASAFDTVFRDLVVGARHASPLPLPPLHAMVQRLVAYRILRHNPRDDTYTTHPLIRNHYFARLVKGEGEARFAPQEAHARIKDYYLELAGDTPRFPTLDDLVPLIEVVHHGCCAGAYDEAWRVFRESIDWGSRGVVCYELGAYDTDLALMLEFFPGGSTAQEPQVSDPKVKSYILNEVGFCLMSLGRLGEAVGFYERGNAMDAELEDWHNASRGYHNLASLHAYLGALAASADSAHQALALARRAENKQYEVDSMGFQAWAAHLLGDLKTAETVYLQAEALQREITPSLRYHCSTDGIKHADHLRRTGQADYARRVAEANLEICEQNRFIKDISLCRRVLGDLDAQEGNHESGRAHYDQALKIARSITFRPALIEALLARGRWAARHQDLTGFGNLSGLAFSDLNEALTYAVEGGYRIYEADARVALAWAHLAAGDRAAAQAEAERAQQMSAEMGYHWGQVDAAEVLAAIDESFKMLDAD